jgi:hypothetical protein
MDLAIEQHRPRSTRMSLLIGRLDRTPAFLHSRSTQTMVKDSPGKLRWFAQRSVPSTPKPALRAMNDRPPAGVRAALLGRRLGTAAILCAVASILAAAFVGVFGIVFFWAVATLLGVAGLIASLVGFHRFSEARWMSPSG